MASSSLSRTAFAFGLSIIVGLAGAKDTTSGGSVITSPSPTSPSATPSTNATYSIREPITSWNLTTSTIETVFPPEKTQAGQPSYCNNWHYVGVGDTCEDIVGGTSRMTMEEFLEWNPELDSDCSGLYHGWWVCIGIQPQTVTATFEYTLTPPPVVVPSPTKFTPTVFPPINSSFTALPTQSGVPQNCQAFYHAKANETCRDVLKNGFPTREEFFEWNPALKGNCDGLWEGYWYCVAAYEDGFPPPPPTVTSSPSPVPTGQTDSCTSWYQATGDETCDDVVRVFVAFSKADFISWNPSVGSDCGGMEKGLFYCVGVPGTPTTRTGPVPTLMPPNTSPSSTPSPAIRV
ncbi:hypothetical protein FQN54_002752 [Arachnomyces sp. PD_36]|nr:hypothetical protein FQN54_002752 [Arachnomyces sp. PD_36]